VVRTFIRGGLQVYVDVHVSKQNKGFENALFLFAFHFFFFSPKVRMIESATSFCAGSRSPVKSDSHTMATIKSS
jgi:hypothetical protein